MECDLTRHDYDSDMKYGETVVARFQSEECRIKGKIHEDRRENKRSMKKGRIKRSKEIKWYKSAG